MAVKPRKCRVCGKAVPWLATNVHAMAGGVVVSTLERNVRNRPDDDGVCLPCLDRFRQKTGEGCFDIRITNN